jgi:hypothetical protein
LASADEFVSSGVDLALARHDSAVHLRDLAVARGARFALPALN